MNNLKRCPFCGGLATIFHIPANTIEEIAMHPKWAWSYPDTWIVGCDSELCIGKLEGSFRHFMSEEQAATAWNRRVNDD